MKPTIKELRGTGFRFFFYSNENDEQPHVHVEKGESVCKWWLDPIELARNFGFSARELTAIRKIIEHNVELILEKWNEHFDN